MGFYIAEDGILHSHCRENINCYRLMEDAIVDSWSENIRGVSNKQQPEE
jgi:hypothetical protein